MITGPFDKWDASIVEENQDSPLIPSICRYTSIAMLFLLQLSQAEMTIRRGLSASGKRALLRRADPWDLAKVKVTGG